MAEHRSPWQPPSGSSRRSSAAQPPGPKSSTTTHARTRRATSSPASIPRAQQWLFAIMVLLVIVMAVSLLRLRQRTAERFADAAQPLPLSAAGGPGEPLHLFLAHDSDGTLAEQTVRYPLPRDPNARARALLSTLLQQYTAPGSAHPLHASAGVEQVFLLPVPGGRTPGARLAVVNLSASFALNHPSGIEPETLTLLSMIATLHANLPQVAQVRFLVDGARQPTLAGHADLLRAYLAAGTDLATSPAGDSQP
jgi:hypothetical protein